MTTSTRTIRNGARHTVVVRELTDAQRSVAVQYAWHNYGRREELSFEKAERLSEMKRLADYGIFPATHIAQIFGVGRSMMTRLGIKPDTGQKKAGGAFNPACLKYIVLSLRQKVLEGRHSSHYIRLAYEGGMSYGVISRLVGVSSSSVLRLVKKAQAEHDRRLDTTAVGAGGSGLAEVREEAVSGITAGASGSGGATDRDESQVSYRLGADGTKVHVPRKSSHSDAQSGATEVEAGCSNGAEGSVSPGTEAGTGPESEAP